MMYLVQIIKFLPLLIFNFAFAQPEDLSKEINYKIQLYNEDFESFKDTLVDLSFLEKNMSQVRHFNHKLFDVVSHGEERIGFKRDSTFVEIFVNDFDSTRHELEFFEQKGFLKSLQKIDGKPFYGTDGEIPRCYINKISVLQSSRQITFNDSNYHDLYEPRINRTRNHLFETNCFMLENDDFFIWMMNSDGAGSYSVLFVFVNGSFYKRIVSGIPSWP